MPTLHWIGKDKVVKHHHEVPFKTLLREYVHTAPEGTPANSTGNRIILIRVDIGKLRQTTHAVSHQRQP